MSFQKFWAKVTKLLKETIKSDTGMDTICCCEMRWGSKSNSSIIETEQNEEKIVGTVTLTEEQKTNYLILTDGSKIPDGFHYICDYCKIKIKRNQYPRTWEKH